MAKRGAVDKYSEASSPKKGRTGKKTLRDVTITPAQNGGHTVQHSYESDGMTFHKPETHVFGKGDAGKLISHLKKNLGIGAAPVEEPGGESEQD